ncbi:MAG TPA: ABC transporter ATP-binding protein [Methanocella sp.]|nr:ABC transporter ATP-binding protein [Methanocella sp.]
MIELKDVEKKYRNDTSEHLALDKISISIDRGEYLAVLGKSGSGKSTLINMITGIDRPSSGEIYVDGAAVHKLTERQAAAWRGHNVGIVFQFFQLIPTLTAIENIMLPMDFCNTFRGKRKERAASLLDMVGLARCADRLPTALSGGERQRAAIARALANDPSLIVADEPTGNLDSRTSASICSLFDDLRAEGKTLVVVSHDENIARHSSRSVTIADGRIVRDH